MFLYLVKEFLDISHALGNLVDALILIGGKKNPY